MTPLPVLVVDVANVMGSRADGWWRDRAGAARRLADEVRAAITDHDVVLVLEGAARSGLPAATHGSLRVVHSAGHGDDAIVDQVRERLAQGQEVTVVTADRVLRERVTSVGARCRGPRWLLDRLA